MVLKSLILTCIKRILPQTGNVLLLLTTMYSFITLLHIHKIFQTSSKGLYYNDSPKNLSCFKKNIVGCNILPKTGVWNSVKVSISVLPMTMPWKIFARKNWCQRGVRLQKVVWYDKVYHLKGENRDSRTSDIYWLGILLKL